MPPFLNDLKSLLPHSSPPPAKLPSVGSPAPLPAKLGIASYTEPTIVACVRHCGCPFAESEVRSLAALSNDNPTLKVFVLCMSPEEDAKLWWTRIGGLDFKDPSRVTLVADPSREVYAALGVGELGWGGLVSGSVLTSLQSLRSKGIVNTETVAGSNRWQNSGGLAIDSEGTVKWVYLASHAGDMCPYGDAVASLGLLPRSQD